MALHIYSIVLLGLLFQTTDMAKPTAEELLDRCTETLDKTHTSFITQSIIHAHKEQKYSTQELAYMNGEREKFFIQEFRTDGKRIKCIVQKWGDFYSSANKEKYFVPESEKGYFSCTYDGDKRYDYLRAHDSAGRVTVYVREPEESLISLDVQIAYSNAISQCFGYLTGDVERFDRILKEAGSGKMSVKEEDLNGTSHYVIDAETNRGKYKIWLNPEKGYNFSKAAVIRETGDLFMMDYEIPTDTVRRTVIENTEFEKVDDLWVPVKAITKVDDTLPNGGYMKSNCEMELTSIVINPDHDALGSFSIDDIKDGAKARISKIPISYIWQDGKLIPNVDKAVISELDKMADEIMAEGKVSACAVSKKDGGSELSLSSLSISDLLKKYQATQSQLQSFIAKGRSTVEYSNSTRQSSRKEETTSEFRFDGNRVNHRSTFWDGLLTTKDKPGYKSFLWDEKSFIKYTRRSTLSNGSVSVRENDALKKFLIATEYKGAPLMGICAGDYDRIDLVLGKADTVKLRDKAEKTGESQCYVIDAATKQAKYTVWFDPEHGYNIAKAEIQIQYKNGGISFLLKDVRFEKITGIWVPMEADIEETKTVNGKANTTRWHHKRTEMVLNPDFETLKSFVSNDIQNGTTVSITGDPGKYIWQDGKPVAETDSNVKP